MTPENFCYWVQGYFEIGNIQSLDSAQVLVVKDHLALVFKKVTPQYPSLDKETASDVPKVYYCDNKRAQQNAEWNPLFFADGNAPLPTGTKTNLYFGGESSFFIDPNLVLRSC